MALAPGMPAPDFELPLVPGEAPLRLSDYRGQKPVVLFFFPLAFSKTCTKEFRALQGDLAAWAELDVELLAISVDSPHANRSFAEACGIPFPVLSDFNRDTITAYGVRNDDFFGLQGVSHRAVFVVDRSGMIVYSWVSEDPNVLPDFDALRAEVVGLS
jgi:peroxiredoxin